LKKITLGFIEILTAIKDNEITLKKAKNSMIVQTDEIEGLFRVESIVDRYIIYFDSAYDFRIAIKKQSGEFYGSGKSLHEGAYKIIGIEEFKTVLGITQQVIIVKELKNVNVNNAAEYNGILTSEKKKISGDYEGDSFKKGWLYLDAEKYDKAIIAFHEASKNNSEAYLGLAETYNVTGMKCKAKKYYEKFLKLNPDYENRREIKLILKNIDC